jgi:branched-chain amino acid transport system ATP-binding protein
MLAAPPLAEAFAAEALYLSFGGVRAIADVSFTVAAGTICAIIGPNGAGKSSLLNLMCGIYQPASGRLRFAGRSVARVTPAEAAALGIARTFQNLALSPSLSVLNNIMLGETRRVRAGLLEQALGLPRARRDEARLRERAEAMLAFLHLQRYRHAAVGKLPYGVQKRVEMARALAAEPQLLLLDEPMAGMNQAEKAELCDVILEVNRRLGTTTVLIEHDIGVVMDLSAHIVVLDQGRKIAEGPPDAVRHDQRVIDAYLGAGPTPHVH